MRRNRWAVLGPIICALAGGGLAAVLLAAGALNWGWFAGRAQQHRPTAGQTETAGATRADEHPTDKTPAAGQGAGDWPAFHNGGTLRGVADPIGPGSLKPRWTYHTGKAGVTNSAAIVGDLVFVADDDGTLHAIGLVTGKRVWTYGQPPADAGPTSRMESGFSTAPLVAGGRVLLGDTGGVFHGVDERTGRGLWKFDSEGSINSSANLTGAGYAVFANDDGKVSCIDPATGKPAWTCELARTNGAPAVEGGLVWVASCNGKLHGLDERSGEEKRAFDMGSQSGAAPAVAGDGGIVIAGMGDQGDKIVCIDGVTGDARWTYPLGDQSAEVYSTAACADGVAVVGVEDNVYAINLADGSKRWVFRTQGTVDSSPAISGGRVFVGSRDGKLYVLELATGKWLGQFDAGNPIAAGPAIGRGVVVVGDSGGNVYCLEPKPGGK